MTTKRIAVKRYVVQLSEGERERLNTLINTGKHPARQLTRARILLKADTSDAGDGWSDSQIAAALDTSIDTVGANPPTIGGRRLRGRSCPQAFPSLGQNAHFRRSQ